MDFGSFACTWLPSSLILVKYHVKGTVGAIRTMDKASTKRFTEGLEALRKKTSAEVSFEACDCGDGGVKGFNEGALEIAEALANNDTVRVLNLSGVHFSDKSATELGTAIGSCPNLERLDLSDNDFSDYGAAGLAAGLATMSKLRSLKLNSTTLSDEGLYNICRHLRHGPPPGQAVVRLLMPKKAISPAVVALLRRGFAADAYTYYRIHVDSRQWHSRFSSTSDVEVGKGSAFSA